MFRKSFIVRLKFQKRSTLKFVSRSESRISETKHSEIRRTNYRIPDISGSGTVPHSGEYNTTQFAAKLFPKPVWGFIPVIAVLVFFTLTATGFSADKYQWRLAGTENDCQLYTSPVPGKDYIAAKTSCIIPARIETIGVVLRDIANYPKWMEDCAETKILKIYDPENDGIIFWFRQHIPLKTDRDMIIKSSVNLDIKSGKDSINAELTKEIPYDSGKGYIRMPSFSSVWTLEWVDREHTRVTFMIDPDLGEGIPKFIANPLIKTTPYKSLKRMMKMVKDSKYIEEGRTSRYNKLVEEAIKSRSIK